MYARLVDALSEDEERQRQLLAQQSRARCTRPTHLWEAITMVPFWGLLVQSRYRQSRLPSARLGDLHGIALEAARRAVQPAR